MILRVYFNYFQAEALNLSTLLELIKTQLKFNVLEGSILDVVRQPILYRCALDKRPGHIIYKEPRIKPF